MAVIESGERSIQPIKDIRLTERGFEEYLDKLDLEEEDLEGKTILDVGAGSRRFAIEAQKRRITCKIISLDPIYAMPPETLSEKNRVMLEKYKAQVTPEIEQATFKNSADAMPFEYNSFDLVLCMNTVPLHMETREQVAGFFSEARRVCRPKNGLIKITPVNRNDGGRTIPGSDRFNKSGLDNYINSCLDEIISEGGFLLEKKGNLVILTKSLQM